MKKDCCSLLDHLRRYSATPFFPDPPLVIPDLIRDLFPHLAPILRRFREKTLNRRNITRSAAPGQSDSSHFPVTTQTVHPYRLCRGRFFAQKLSKPHMTQTKRRIRLCRAASNAARAASVCVAQH